MVVGANFDATFICQIEDVSSSEAVADCCKVLDALRLEVLDCGVEGRHSLLWSMVREPCAKLRRG